MVNPFLELEEFKAFLDLDRNIPAKPSRPELDLNVKPTLEHKPKKNGRGFHNSRFHNANHSKTYFSESEKQFKDLALKRGISERDLEHEKRVSFKVSGANKQFWLDFYHKPSRTCIEINPLFHYTYSPVIERDREKKRLLKRRLHINTLTVKVYCRTRKGKYITEINRKYAREVIEKLKRYPLSRECLDYYTMGEKTIKGLNRRLRESKITKRKVRE